MFGFNKTSLAPAPREEYLHEVIPNTYHLIPFQVYQVGILHPDTWQVYINPSKTFAFHDGFAKIDRSAEKSCPDQASLALRWACLLYTSLLTFFPADRRPCFCIAGQSVPGAGSMPPPGCWQSSPSTGAADPSGNQ